MRASAIAWVESPLQAVAAVEVAAHTHTSLEIVPRRGSRQLAHSVAELSARGLPNACGVSRPRSVIPLARFLGRRHWVVGDPFSGQVRALLALRRPGRLTVVDDGSMTLHLGRLYASGLPFCRAGASEGAIMRLLGRMARRSIARLAAAGRVDVFTYHDARGDDMVALRELGARIAGNEFSWLRGGATAGSAARQPAGSRILLGSASVVDGFATSAEYLAWVRAEASREPVLYAPHRREDAVQLAAVAALPGVTMLDDGLPIELRLVGTSRPLHIVTLPSSAAGTLAIVLEGTDSTIEVRSLAGAEVVR